MNVIRIANGLIEAAVDMEDGMNVTSLKYRDVDVIERDEMRKAKGATYAVPVLFPTPNRTAGGFYSFRGQRVAASMHGYARHAAFSVSDRSSDSVTGTCSFEGLSDPYDISMTLTIRAYESSISWIFRIENMGEAEFPFSLALHPFFRKDVFRTLSLNCEYEMEADGNKIPTGRLIRLDDRNGYDKRDIAGISADTVYLSSGGVKAELDAASFSLVIAGDDSFRHLVVYGYPGSSFICAEPQTGSTDFVNLHERGFEKAAGLLSLCSGDVRSLYVDFCFRDRAGQD